jgi:hypothetical protein
MVEPDTGGVSSPARRDLGLRRIGSGTRFLAVGAVLVGGVLSAAVAKALPGKSASHATSTTPPTTSAPADVSGGSSTVTPALTAPTQAPQPAISPPVVSSGGS